MIKLYLDDERPCPDGFMLARNLAEFKKIVLSFEPEFISFDHDLGGDEIGLDAIKWLISIDYPLPENGWRIHSANPVGRDNMQSLLLNWFKHRTK